MSTNSMSSIEDARKALQAAIDYGRPLDIIQPSKDAATAFRFRIYDAKRKEKRLLDVVGDENSSRVYDNIRVTIHKTSQSESDFRHSVRLTPIDKIKLEIIDAETGKPLEIADEPTPEFIMPEEVIRYDGEDDDDFDDGGIDTAEE